MKRREFITLLGGAAMACPLAARAQQRERMRRIGVLMAMAADDPESQARLAAFAQGLQQSGWTVGQNIRIEYRWAGANVDNMRQYATELSRARPGRHSGPFQRGRRTVVTGHPYRSDRVHDCRRPCRRWLRR